MSDSIVWKEAKSHRVVNDHDDDDDNADDVSKHANDRQTPPSQEDDSEPESISQNSCDDNGGNGEAEPSGEENVQQQNVQSIRGFSHHQISLKLRRNITALADPAQHKPKIEYALDGQNRQTFESWLENALVAISPSADMILFTGQTSEKLQVFIAKLRMEPVYQYTTKSVDIPLDYDERITSLLCLPIMSTQRTALGSVDWTALVFGLSSGYVKFYTEQSICLLSLKFCDEPVVSLKLQTQKVNTNARSQAHFASIVDELFIVHRTCAFVTDGIGLYENLRISKEDVIKSKSNYEPAYNLTNLPTILTCQKWKFDDTRDNSRVLDADLLGMRSSTRFDTLKSDSINFDYVAQKSYTRSLVLVGRNPFIACYREAKDVTSHSYTEMIGSLLPFWNKPAPTRVHINDITCSSQLSLFDKGRLATSIVASPDKRLAAMTDDFGRVMLVDVTNWLVVRLWKGYRHAQCGWVEVKRNPEESNTPYASFLVIYAPKRGLLEVWSVQRGPRVAAFNVGKDCRLLYVGHRMLNMRAEGQKSVNKQSSSSSLLVEQSYGNNCYLLDAKSETIFSIELPYTYSLYKYGDLKSRDQLLINELVAAIQHDSEVNTISEILLRMSLAESQQVSIQKIALHLQPDKIVPILENLINKIMKDYDNHSGEIMSDDDQSIVELCKRILRLCSMFSELTQFEPSNISLPDVNQRLIEEYDDHPHEVDEFAQGLGWEASEILRYLSLLALERSYRKDSRLQNPWPNMGEPLTWAEFVTCFDLERVNYRHLSRRRQSSSSSTTQSQSHPSHSSSATADKITIRLKESTAKFLQQDKVIKTSIFMYNKLSENFYRSSANVISVDCEKSDITGSGKSTSSIYLTHLEPASRLILLFQFWLSTKLCHHWKMWAFLQRQVGLISDELRVIVMTQENDDLLVEVWKKIYQLILESDNIYAAIIATAAIRSDTLRMISDNEKREKLERENKTDKDDDNQTTLSATIDWECLCVDAERMSIFSRQLEDVFLLSLLLRYSPDEHKLVDRFVYRVARISVSNVIRGGATIVSELVAQWAVHTNIDPKIFTQFYGVDSDEELNETRVARQQEEIRPRIFSIKQEVDSDDDHTKELLHHVKTSFPCSLEPDVLLLNCIWEFCNRWTGNSKTTSGGVVTSLDKMQHLNRAFSCLSLLSEASLRHNSASWAYKTFFQRTFERLTILIETNSTILSPKCARSRDTLARRELNMSESCLEDFVLFCHKLSEFMLATCRNMTPDANEQEVDNNCKQLDTDKLSERLLSVDEWWTSNSSATFKMMNKRRASEQAACNVANNNDDHHTVMTQGNSLVRASLSPGGLFHVNVLIELNRLTTLMVLIFKLKLIKAYPLSLIGEESRQLLKLDLQQSPIVATTTTTGGSGMESMKSRSSASGSLLNDLRQKFAQKCIVSIVVKISDESSEFDHLNNDDDDDDVDSDEQNDSQDIDTIEDGGKRRRAKIKEQAGKDDVASNSASSQTVATTIMSSGTKQTETTPTTTVASEAMTLFTHLLSLAYEWQLNCDELYLEMAFELYRCQHDELASMVASRIQDKQTFGRGLLKIASQRILVMFGLSPKLSSGEQWRKRSDKWSLFQPNISTWLKSIQEEEIRHELGPLSFPENVKASRPTTGDIDSTPAPTDFEHHLEQSLGLQMFAIRALCERTKCVLETVTNYLDGRAYRLAYDLLQLLDYGRIFDKFIAQERSKWSSFRDSD